MMTESDLSKTEAYKYFKKHLKGRFSEDWLRESLDELGDHTGKRRSRLKRITADRNHPPSGQTVADELLKLARKKLTETQPDDPNISETSPKWQMFSEIVARCAFDAVGNIFSVNAHGSKYNGFDAIFAEIAEKEHPKDESLYRKVLNHVQLYRKGFVQTPHPTEILDQDAIRAEIKLHHDIEKYFAKANGTAHLEGSQRGDLEDKLKELFDAIKPVRQGMAIKDEIKRSIEFSELAFNAIPHMVQGIIDPAIRKGRRDTHPLTAEELRHFGRMLEPGTWSPGDQDSKREMTSGMLKYGIEQNRTNMAMQYAIKIGEILKGMGVPTASDKDSKKDAYKKLKQLRLRILKSIPAKVLPHKEAPAAPDTAGDKFLDHWQRINGNDLSDEVKKEIADGVRIAAAHLDGVKEFTSAAEMIKAAEEIRQLQIGKRPQEGKEIESVKFPPFNESEVLNQLDVLVAQMHSFGNYALHPQIRQNAEMHEDVMQQVGALIPELQGDPKQRAEQLLAILNSGRGDELRNKINNKVAEGDAIRGKDKNDKDILEVDLWRKEMQGLKDKIIREGDNAREEDRQKAERLEKRIDFYETLSSMKLAAEHPDAIPRYLIAECRSSTDILEAFALLKLMEPQGEHKPERLVEIVPLVEYSEHMAIVPQMLKEAYDNPYFRKHHQIIGQSNDAAFITMGLIEENKEKDKISAGDVKRQYGKEVQSGNEERLLKNAKNKIGHHLTVADIKRAYGIAFPKDEQGSAIMEQDKAPIDHTKMVMFAGSDIMKSAGPSGAALTQHTIEDLRANMLEWKDKNGKPAPVLLLDYTGLGGGMHRSQPAATMIETTQGRSMRQTAGNIAQKALLTMARFVKRMLGISETAEQLLAAVDDRKQPGTRKEKRKKAGRLAQVNLGNMAGFKVEPQWWEQGVKQRSDDCMKHYKELYDSPEFGCMMAFSADKFVKLTSYAARPAGRTRAGSDTKDYPPIVDVKELRAIGYGAALNVSGSCAGLYYGASKFLHADAILKGEESIDALEKAYREDPKVQDVVNRATFGISMANMDAAWQYLGKKRTVDKDNQMVYISDIRDNREAQPVRTMASGDKAVKQLLQEFKQPTENLKGKALHKKKMEWLGSLNREQKRALAIHALAKVDEEYQKVSEVLLKLHGFIANEPENPEYSAVQQQIIRKLPQALRLQIQSYRNNMGQIRHDLAEQFHQSWHDEDNTHPLRKGIKEVRTNNGDEKAYNDIYYRMGALQEVFENVPRAFSRPFWALEVEKAAEPQLVQRI